MADEEIIQQTEQASQTEQVSKDGAQVQQIEQAPPALTKEQVEQIVADATAKAVAEAKELGKRELQSAQDRNKAELARAQRRAEMAEATMGAARIRIQGTDPEMARELELVELREKEKYRSTLEQEEAQLQQQTEQATVLQNALYEHLKTLGIAPEDKRLDWAVDSSNYVEGRSRFDSSVARIIQEDKQVMQTSFDQRLKDLEAQVGRVNVEVNSVDTAAATGGVEGSDADFLRKFASGELDLTKETQDRYYKIINKE